MKPKPHFDVRFKERYGMKLKKKDRLRIIAGIKKGIYKLEKTEGTRSVYFVPIRELLTKIVFDHSNDALVTICFINKTEIIKIRNKDGKRKKSKLKDIYNI